MSDQPSRPFGAFPVVGPVPYLSLPVGEVAASLVGPFPPLQTWFHRTPAANVESIARFGIVPSCWRGGDCCCVFGATERSNAERSSDDWLVQVDMPSLEGDAKAWWVPPQAVTGAFFNDTFFARNVLLLRGSAAPLRLGSCNCEIDHLVRAEIARWCRHTTRTRPSTRRESGTCITTTTTARMGDALSRSTRRRAAQGDHAATRVFASDDL